MNDDRGRVESVFVTDAAQDSAMLSADQNTQPKSPSAWETDLGCPGCGYNLRGLPPNAGMRGVAVDCPECGLRSDLAELAQRRWDKPWYKAPGFNRMTLPVAWLLLGTVAVLLAAGAMSAAMGLNATASWLSTLGLLAVMIAGWVLLLVWVYLRNGGIVGVLFSLLAHLVLVGYVGGLLLCVGGGISILTVVFRGPGRHIEVSTLVVGATALGLGVGLFVVGRICEKQVAGHCIRLYLKHGPR